MTALADRAVSAEKRIESISREQEAALQELNQMKEERETLLAERAQLELSRSELESSLADLRREQTDLRSSLLELRTEKVLLQDRLQSALSEVADTRESARGFIVNLPDILFDVGEATLKPAATTALAKLAGILLIMQDLNLRVEGHTDSTGTASFNLRLSERRADSVFDFLAEQGIPSNRMKTAGYGIERPIASNATADGRSKNRRVEIVIAKGEVEEE
jgi:outer membrane protein OmpA-like peptidoglycan-associated protein